MPRADAIGPTPETAAKLVPDVIDVLVRQRVLRQFHADAAREIELVYLALCRGIYGAGGFSAGARGGGPYRSALERLTLDEEAMWRGHYAPWCREVGRFAEVVFDVKVNNRAPTPWEIAPLRLALSIYAGIAGFTSSRRPHSVVKQRLDNATS